MPVSAVPLVSIPGGGRGERALTPWAAMGVPRSLLSALPREDEHGCISPAEPGCRQLLSEMGGHPGVGGRGEDHDGERSADRPGHSEKDHPRGRAAPPGRTLGRRQVDAGLALAGLRVPQSGLLLLEGLDRHSLGLDGWRRRAVAAPQFQENHVLTNTFAFNLLMGREWPPRPGDFEEAQAVCRELGLGELLDRMPAGLLQMVGESGWQLSHGEKSRLYIARALLQRAELVVLDESFAALDPESLRRALRCVLERARTLLVIAHP